MTDGRIRALERRAARTGGADDEAAWLLARLRAGDLAPARVHLLVHLGYPAARLATGAPVDDAPPRGVVAARRWAVGLGAFGREACARAALALARACAAGLASAPRHLDRAVVTDVLAAVEAALTSPSRATLRAVRAARTRALMDTAWIHESERHRLPAEATRARLVAIEAATAVGAPTGPRAAAALAQAAAWACAAHDVRAVVRDALAPWALRGSRP